MRTVNQKGLTKAQNFVLAAQAAYEIATETEDAIYEALLAGGEYTDEDGEPVTSAKHMYMVNDTQFEALMHAAHNEFSARGINNSIGNTYKEPFRLTLRAAEDALIEYCKPMLPLVVLEALPKIMTHWRLRGECVNTHLRLRLS